MSIQIIEIHGERFVLLPDRESLILRATINGAGLSTPLSSIPDQPTRSVGWAKGVLPELPDSFFQELPPDILDLFEGKAA